MPESQTALDEASKRIIEQLRQDGRRPYATIGKAVGLSEAAVRQRVQRMVESGVIQIVAVTDPGQAGFRRQAMVGVRIQGEVDPVVTALDEITEISSVVTVAGSVDLLVELVCEDDDRLLEVLTTIRRIPGVVGTETHVYLKLHRELSERWMR